MESKSALNVNNMAFNERFALKWEEFKLTFHRELKERYMKYLKSTAMSGLHYLVENNLDWKSKFIWRVVHLTAISMIGLMIWVAMMMAKSLTLTTRMPVDAPLASVPFPGIAICSVNKISKNKATILAKEIMKNGVYNGTEVELVQLLGYIGLAFDFEETADSELEEIHSLLPKDYNLETLIKSLAPDCEELLPGCMWRDEYTRCDNIFSIHKTSEGFCCTFNYLRESDNFIRNDNISLKKVKSATMPKIGLDVVLDPMLDDYLYTRMPSVGFKVMMFKPSDFPDVPSGGCLDQMVTPCTEQFIIMDATIVTASEEVQGLSQENRGCYLPKDSSMYGSYSDCVMTCRITSVLDFCGCIPFLWPSNNLSDPCDLMDNGCLKKWKKMWENAWSGEDQSLENTAESSECDKGPPCAYCIPECSDTSYKARRYSIPLPPIINLSFGENLPTNMTDTEIYPLNNISLLHIYFEKDYFVHLSHDLMLTWYDWMGFLGGLCGLVMGCSVLTVAEFIYFMLFGGPREETAMDNEEDLKDTGFEEEEQIENLPTLYWGELEMNNKTLD